MSKRLRFPRQVFARALVLALVFAVAASLAACAAKSAAPSAPAVDMPAPSIDLIPRETIFGNPDRAAVRLSPDGRWISWLAPDEGVLNIFVAPAGDLAAAVPVTFDRGRGIRGYFWAYAPDRIVYVQDEKGDENWRVYSVNTNSRETLTLTPTEKVRANIEAVSENFPNEILVGLNDRDERYHDVWRVNIETGAKTLVKQNEDYAGFMIDDNYTIRFAVRQTPDGGMEYLIADGDDFSPYLTIGPEDVMTTNPLGFDKSGENVFLLDSRGRNTAALYTMNLATKEKTLLVEDGRADVGGIITHPTGKYVQAASVNYLRNEWTVLDPDFEPDLAALRAVSDGELIVASRTMDDATWIAAFVRDDGPLSYYIYDRASKSADFLFVHRDALKDLPLARMHPVVIPARDGLNLVSYLSLPPAHDKGGRPDKPLPLVLNVHGGPWARDAWGYDPEAQWLTNRGYATLAVNYRGSTGFGKDFINAANMEWAGKMHDDLIDAVRWAIAQGIADPNRIAIFGWSYGGYATLVGVTFTPDQFACGVAGVGPSNLMTLLNSIPPYWEPMIELFTSRVGDHRTDEGRAFLASRSPLTFVDRIKKPLLIGQGANDPRVKQAEADQIVDAMQEKNIPVTYLLYPDEGHGFARPQNRMSFYAVAEAFLSRCAGGEFQPIGGDFEGSSIEVKTGADYVPGLAESAPN
ncbi:S9 family peptidase [bacterium]|nr:S9 family peptidase [bacterium]